jgi:hypothetical protein
MDPVIQLRKLQQWLANQAKLLTQERHRIVQSPEAKDLPMSLAVNSSREITFLEVLRKLEELESGSFVQPDPLGADLLPPVTETGELDDL